VSLRVGVDLVEVEAVRAALQEHGDRYLQRTFTERELVDCSSADGVSVERLAARFAAKEAAMKALRLPPDEGIAWTSIEVVRAPEGWTSLRLAGDAAALAERQGIGELAVSVAHEGAFATAVVVAIAPEGER